MNRKTILFIIVMSILCVVLGGTFLLFDGTLNKKDILSYDHAYAGSSGNVTWSGYTGTTTGSVGGIKGMNNTCNTSYSGSHACTYDEIINLGNNYPYTYDAWVIDGSYYSAYHFSGASAYQVTRDGAEASKSWTVKLPLCGGWTQNSSNYGGPAMLSTGVMAQYACNNSLRIPCCDD